MYWRHFVLFRTMRWISLPLLGTRAFWGPPMFWGNVYAVGGIGSMVIRSFNEGENCGRFLPAFSGSFSCELQWVRIELQGTKRLEAGVVVKALGFHQCGGGWLLSWRHVWVGFVGSLLCSDNFCSAYSGSWILPPLIKTNVWVYWFYRPLLLVLIWYSPFISCTADQPWTLLTVLSSWRSF